MSNVFTGIFGLHTYADSIIRKGRYWERKDGSKWWRNPDTNTVEPYAPNQSVSGQKVSHKHPGTKYSDNQWGKLKESLSYPSREILNKFDELTPEEQNRILENLEIPELAFISGSELGGILGYNLLSDSDAHTPLAWKLHSALEDLELPYNDTETAKDRVLSVIDDYAVDVAEKIDTYFGAEAASEFEDSVSDIMDLASEYFEEGSRVEEFDTEAADEITNRFESTLINVVRKYLIG